MKKHIYYIIVIAGLLVVDAILVIKNRQEQQQISVVQKLKEQYHSLNYCRKLQCFNQSFLKNEISDIQLVLFIPEVTCPHCSEYLLGFLAHHNTLAHYTKVVFLGPYFDMHYHKLSTINYQTIKNMKKVFCPSFRLEKPTAVIMDRHNALMVHEITPGDGFQGAKMSAFWAGAKQFFQHVYDSKENPFPQVVN